MSLVELTGFRILRAGESNTAFHAVFHQQSIDARYSGEGEPGGRLARLLALHESGAAAFCDLSSAARACLLLQGRRPEDGPGVRDIFRRN